MAAEVEWPRRRNRRLLLMWEVKESSGSVDDSIDQRVVDPVASNDQKAVFSACLVDRSRTRGSSCRVSTEGLGKIDGGDGGYRRTAHGGPPESVTISKRGISPCRGDRIEQ